MSEMDDVVREFLVESYDNLDQLDADLLTLEQDPLARDTLARIFRTVHTIKGTCGFLGFTVLEAVSHAGENLLSRLRDGVLAVDRDIATALLELTDALRAMLEAIEANGHEGDEERQDLVDRLERLQRRAHATPGSDDEPTLPPSASAAPADPGGAATVAAADPSEPAEAPPPPLGQMLIGKGLVKADDVTFAVHEQQLGDRRRLGEILVDQGAITQKDLDEAIATQRSSSLTESSIRVDVGVLDTLMTLVGELVLARNQVLELTSESDDAALVAASQRLNLITTELQDSVMKTRLQPIGSLWSRFPRVLRDLALACGKQVRLEMEGEDTELDRTILEGIKDPLVHLIRNAVDHGVESPERRRSAGKAAEACVVLRAYHEGGHVNIEMSDDGGGIDPDAIRAKAVDSGLLTVDDAGGLSDGDAIDLVFAPGLSTAEHVTSVSGRGVGMDVVKTNIEQVGGTIDVASERGRGTLVRVKIPLTLTIIPALTITCREQRYAIPQASVLELVRLQGDQGSRGIEMVHGAPVCRSRGDLLPLVSLAGELHGDGAAALRGGHPDGAVVNIVVLQAAGRRFGLVVDRVNDTQEIVVKPLGAQLRDVPVYAGATIMGDGRVALILDALGLAERAGLFAEGREAVVASADVDVADVADDRDGLLVVALGDDRRYAIRLAEVAGLEEIDRADVEHTRVGDVVQHRGRVLPLRRLSSALGVADRVERDRMRVVVVGQGDEAVGVLVDGIVDIVHQRGADDVAARPGAHRPVVISGRVVDVVDVGGLLGIPTSPAPIAPVGG